MRRLWHGLAVLLLAVFGADMATADERILSFRSAIEVNPDATVRVTEDIRFQVEGREIRRGILRDFPTRYRNRLGAEVNVGFEVLDVRRNGQPESYRIESLSNGKRIRIGRGDVLLDHGIHTYTITYRTTRQLGFLEEFDELYWNVTGNGWTFPIDSVEATVTLPPGASVTQSDAYTGAFGDRGTAYTAAPVGDGQMTFRTTQPLPLSHGLTIAVAWPKGFVEAPDALDEASWLIADNRVLAFGGIGLLIVAAYYVVVWRRVGRDPAAGTIIPLFEPPEGLSPAAVGFVANMGFLPSAFTAALVSMAVKGHVQIEESGEEYSVRRLTGATQPLKRGEKALYRQLFAWGHEVELKQANHRVVGGARRALGAALKNEYDDRFFVHNRFWFVIGAAVSLIVTVLTLLTSDPGDEVLFVTMWFTIWMAGCLTMLWRAVRLWQVALSSGRGWGAALGVTIFVVPFWAAAVFVPFALVDASGLQFFLFGGAMAALNLLFFYLLKAPTAAGREMLDQVEGFKRYLSVAEQDRLDRLHPPEMTPALFEALLPYAIALGVEHRWSERFAAVLHTSGERYEPRWYVGRNWDGLDSARIAGSIADGLGSDLSAAISAAATAPGSRSGSSGGGSSGGGGGGGGGSGW